MVADLLAAELRSRPTDVTSPMVRLLARLAPPNYRSALANQAYGAEEYLDCDCTAGVDPAWEADLESRAGIAIPDEVTRALRDRVEMKLDHEVDAAYPQRWIGKVTVHTADGRELHGRVDEPKGDPGNTLSREEITAKALRLAAFSGGATAVEMQAAVDALWGVAEWPRVGALLPPAA